LLGDLQRFLVALDDAVAAGRDRHAGLAGGFARHRLVAHGADRGGFGPMNLMLQLSQTSAKWAFSARNP
jgi:hypothetical protein